MKQIQEQAKEEVEKIDKKIECTTGPLGQGFATSVGMAMAGKYNGSYFSRKKLNLFDYRVYTMVSDGDLMEGVALEAASLAGNLALDNLIVLYDSNDITLDGPIDKSSKDNIIQKFVNMGFSPKIITYYFIRRV